MGIEEQKEEREVLDSIFPDEITDVTDTEYRVSIALDVSPDYSIDGDDAEELPTILLHVRYPPDYPDEAPELDISAPSNAPKHPLLDIQEDKPRLLESLQTTIEENIGMAMVFTLVSTLKDSAELLVTERQKAEEAEKEFEAAKAEEEENRKFVGTAVTKKSFLEWRERFRQEMVEEEKRKQEEKEIEDKKRRVAKEEKKLTGRELWERGLAGKTDEEDEEEGADGLEGLKRLKVSG
ncbi:RWD-domain-containing protein [Pseudovirgaria hyperparasitica]|uniref:RWD-domain-containing protein n=1 Tax=Pseudovirgaria hyperparasitica TaxID=470096 RepID=A0A6A6WGU0_9PEZI|nr:RWD-domain-containing protein [Pseudovirgaria hyperparasitica]KAF2762028.1 RWD-domain-containing protein [Pseudovirgaria hyperparasitica]